MKKGKYGWLNLKDNLPTSVYSFIFGMQTNKKMKLLWCKNSQVYCDSLNLLSYFNGLETCSLLSCNFTRHYIEIKMIRFKYTINSTMVYFLRWKKKSCQLNNWLIEVSNSWKNIYILRFEVWFKFEWARCTTNNTCMIFFSTQNHHYSKISLYLSC